jgi:hypothetical protein
MGRGEGEHSASRSSKLLREARRRQGALCAARQKASKAKSEMRRRKIEESLSGEFIGSGEVTEVKAEQFQVEKGKGASNPDACAPQRLVRGKTSRRI